MITSNLLAPLQEALELSRDLIRLAEAEEWEEMEVQSQRYQQQVSFLNDENYLKALQEGNLVDDAKELIAQIQVLNESLDATASESREKIASELRQIIQSNKAIDAYGR